MKRKKTASECEWFVFMKRNRKKREGDKYTEEKK